MQIFKAKKGNFWIYIVGSLLFLLIMFFINYNELDNYWFLLPITLPLLFFVWIYFSTKYAVNDHYLYYQSAFLKGKIDIKTIKSIEANATLWSGTKPAMAKNGLIIKFGYDEIYIAPENNDKLIQHLLEINPNIIIK